ncbi:MAG TPA: hypothetical protein VG079_06555 [Gaiellaceae bacterium]|nr:hypothetical protein [Gaiellaceae bacterium]
MRPLASLFAATLAFAAFATSAAAKEVKSAKVCGPSDCVMVKERWKATLLVSGEGGPGSPPPASPFYTVEVRVEVPEEEEAVPAWTFYYVPSAEMTRPAYDPRGDTGPSAHSWWTMDRRGVALLARVTKGLEPFPKPDISSVVIGSKRVVERADSYLALYELPNTRGGRSGSLPVEYSEWINLRSTEPSPWTDLPRDLSFSPSAGLMERGGQVVRIPEELLADIQAGRPLAAEPTGGASSPWTTLAATLAAALAALVAIALLLRRVRIPFPRRRPSAA